MANGLRHARAISTKNAQIPTFYKLTLKRTTLSQGNLTFLVSQISLNLPAMTEVDLSLFPRIGLTLPSLLGGTRKFPSQLAAPTLELECKQKTMSYYMKWSFYVVVSIGLFFSQFVSFRSVEYIRSC